MASKFLFIMSALVVSCLAQRSPYARRPVGYPVIEPFSPTPSNDLINKFGTTQSTTTTTQRLPIEALGDRQLVETLSKLPEDKQPFWLLNWKALEEHRKEGHTYQHKPSNFIDSTSFMGSRGSRVQNSAFF